MKFDIEQIKERLRNTQQALRKQAADDGGVSDPNERGSVTPKDDPKYGEANADVPNMTNSATTGVGSTNQTNLQQPLNPSQTGTNVPSTDRQEPKDDAATAPTTDISKIAARIKQLISPTAPPPATEPAKTATATAPAAPPENGWDPEVKTKMATALGIDEATLETLTPEKLEELTRDRLVKLATLALEAEGGVETMAELIEKKAGQDEVRLVIQQAVTSHALMSKEASYEEEQAAAQLAHLQQVQEAARANFQELTKNASEHDVAIMRQFDAAIEKAASLFLAGDTPNQEAFEAFVGGMKQAAADMEAIEAGQTPPGMEPAEGEAMPPEGEMPPEGAEGMEGDPGSEEKMLLAALEQALAEGKIQPEQAAQILEALQAEGAPDTPENVVEEDMKAAAAGLSITL